MNGPPLRLLPACVAKRNRSFEVQNITKVHVP